MVKLGSGFEAALILYERLIATQPGLERKGKAMPYTSLNGHMFSFLTAEGTLALRLNSEARQGFVTKYKTKPVIQHGATLQEYVSVPALLLKKTKELAPYFVASLAYVRTLKPKPTKKTK